MEPNSPGSQDGCSGRHGTGTRIGLARDELAAIAALYGLSEITSVHEPRRGSGTSAKAVLTTATGRFLVKRRARSIDARRRFALAVHHELAESGVPVASLLKTTLDGLSEVIIDPHAYDVCEWIDATAFDGSIGATADAGSVLARFHTVLASSLSAAAPARQEPQVSSLAAAAGARLGSTAGGVVKRLALGYADAARRVRDLGIAEWPGVVIHGDWHPGNVLFRGDRVVAVVDFDDCCLAPRTLDIANGALQFSMDLRGGAARAPGLDEQRCVAFCRGYEAASESLISTAEISALPWLMIQSLVIEALSAIAAAGSLGSLDGPTALRIVDAQAAWMQREADRLRTLLSG
ncbi:MAG: phosphotransferase enzyme family protein [Phycisphaerales bacterium]